MVTKVDSYIESGKFETTVRAIWESAGQRSVVGFPSPDSEETEEQCRERIQAVSLLPAVPPDPIHAGEATFDPESGEELVAPEASAEGDAVGDAFVIAPTDVGGTQYE